MKKREINRFEKQLKALNIPYEYNGGVYSLINVNGIDWLPIVDVPPTISAEIYRTEDNRYLIFASRIKLGRGRFIPDEIYWTIRCSDGSRAGDCKTKEEAIALAESSYKTKIIK